MPLTRAEFKECFRSVIAEEVYGVPASEESIDISFSKAFEKRIDRLIKAVNHRSWCWVNTAAKRVALIAALLLILFSTAYSVKAIRGPMIRFFTEIYEKYIVVVFEGDTSKTIEYVYSFSEIPEGYTVIEKWKDVTGALTTLEGPDGAILQLDQSITDNGDIYQDNEMGAITQHFVDGIFVLYYKNDKLSMAIWTRDSYSFTLTHHGEIAQDTMFDFVRSIK